MPMSDKWKRILSKVAPALGTAIGGPFGTLAGGIVAQALLGKKDATEEEIAAAVEHATPEDFLKLKELDQQFARDMKALDVDIFKTEIADKASARELYKTNYWPQVVLSTIYNVGYFAMLFLFLTGRVTTDGLPAEMQGAFLTLLGVLTAALPQINGFWFGSSFGSKEKTTALAASSPVQK